jgi:hypothetical protein
MWPTRKEVDRVTGGMGGAGEREGVREVETVEKMEGEQL